MSADIMKQYFSDQSIGPSKKRPFPELLVLHNCSQSKCQGDLVDRRCPLQGKFEHLCMLCFDVLNNIQESNNVNELSNLVCANCIFFFLVLNK